MDPQNIAIGNRIFNLRTGRGLTREKLAEMADISVQFLSDIEKGKKSMTIATLRRLCDALSVTADYIVYDRPTPTPADEIAAMINTLPPGKQQHARELLIIFTDSHK